MYPVIIQIGPIVVYSLWLFAGIGFLVGVYIFTYLAKVKRLNVNFIYKHSISIFLSALIFSRLVFVIKNFSLYFYNFEFEKFEFSLNNFLQIFSIWDKGLSFYGALLGIILIILFYSFREKEQTRKWFDILTISTLFAVFIGNIGTFLDGTAYGRPTQLPWGMQIENFAIAYAVPIHPTQLYAALYSLIIAIVLFVLYRKKRLNPGEITVYGILSYFTFLFLEGFVRGDPVFVFLNLREEQWISLFILLITGSYLVYQYNKKRGIKTSEDNNETPHESE